MVAFGNFYPIIVGLFPLVFALAVTEILKHLTIEITYDTNNLKSSIMR